MRQLLPAALLFALVAACGDAKTDGEATAGAQGAPVPSGPPNADFLQPAFERQTRAPEVKSTVAVATTTVAEGLDTPWGMVFLPDGRILVSERPGQLRIVARDGTLSGPVAGVPKVDARGQGGLLGLALDPQFASNGLVYMSFAEPREGGQNNTAVARGRLVAGADGAPGLDGVTVIFRQTPAMESRLHYGGRLLFAPDGKLFITTGERSIVPGRVQAQQLDGTLGKMVRINADGSIPQDNPFVGQAGAKPEIWSYGHRNIQAATFHPTTGALWEVEHGPRGGDELNKVEPGKNYGWPVISYGVEYAGGKIGDGIGQQAGMEQPVYYWDPVIAPSGMAFYEANLFPEWKGDLFIGGLGSMALVRLEMEGDRVVGEERLLTDLEERVRDVVVGPDGAIYIVTDSSNGKIIRLARG